MHVAQGTDGARPANGNDVRDASALRFFLYDLCDDGVTCPPNRLLVEDSSTLAVIVGSLVQIGAIAVAATAVTILWRRYDRASPALRRTLAPVYLTSTIVIVGVMRANSSDTAEAEPGRPCGTLDIILCTSASSAGGQSSASWEARGTSCLQCM